MSTCADCRYWKTPIRDHSFFEERDISVFDDDTHGICERTVFNTYSGSLWIKSDNKMVVRVIPSWSDDEPIDLDVWLETKADFGCVQYEPMPATQEQP